MKPAERTQLIKFLEHDPVWWMEHYFYIPDVRDPYTGEELGEGPIQLHPIQKRILRAVLLKDKDGKFPYSTILFSTIKKSGKTRIAAGVAAWYAATQGRYNEVYCMANDGRQSVDRILSAVKQFVELNPEIHWKVTTSKITLPSGTYIEAIPCDPKGSAGANPGLTVWSEMWGYAHRHKERLWTEMTIPPTRYGKAMRWVESYAGYTDESNVLFSLYEQGTKYSRPHPAFREPGGPPAYVNEPASQFTYWDDGDAARRMPWQTPEYYAQERSQLVAKEFDRIHRNYWIDSIDKALDIIWWDACRAVVPPLDERTPVVMAADASVSHDSTALVLVSRHPDPARARRETMVRACEAWYPPPGEKINLTETLEKRLREWVKKYNVVCLVYDKYQLHKMMTDIRMEGIVRVKEFGQQSDRAVADKQLYDMILTRMLAHDGNQELRAHVDHAASKTIGEKFRFIKASDQLDQQGRTAKPIDLLIGVSMGNHECLRLNLG